MLHMPSNVASLPFARRPREAAESGTAASAGRATAAGGLERAVFDSIATALAVVDADWTILAVNPAWIEMGEFGVTHNLTYRPGANLRALNRARAASGAIFAARCETAIDEVLAHDLKGYMRDLPIDSAAGEYCFTIRVARLIDGSNRFLIAFTDRTAQRSAENRAEGSATLLATVLDLLPQAVAWKDREGRYLGASRAFLVQAGTNDIYGKTDAELPWHSLAEEFAALDREVFETRAPILDRLAHFDNGVGAVKWWRCSRAPLDGPDGGLNAILCSFTDVSEQRLYDQSIARMAEEMSRLALVARRTNNAVVIADAGRRITWVNRGFENMFGYRAEEVIGRHAIEIFQTDLEGAPTLEAMRMVLSSGCAFRGELRLLDRQERVRWLESELQPLADGNGRPAGWISILTDITAQVNLRASAEDSEQRLQLALASTGLATWSWDCQTHAMSGDARFAAINGLPATAFPMAGGIWIDCVLAEDRPAIAAQLLEAMAGAAAQFPRFRLARPDGSVRLVEASARIDRRADGLPRRLVGVLADVSDRVRADEERARSEKLESIGQLASGIAHEINTPVQYASDSVFFSRDGAGDLIALARDALDALRELSPAGAVRADELAVAADFDYLAENMPKALERTLEGLNRVAGIVRSMKEFAHPGERAMTPVDLNRLVGTILTMARNEYKYVADVATDFATLPPVACRAGDIGQVVLNVVVNAAHAIAAARASDAPKGRIEVRTRLTDAHAVIEVADNGTGIPEEIRGRIFDPFFTTKDVGVGTGQGLAIARRVMKAHQGELAFETVVGRGTTFFIRLPLQQAAVMTEDKVSGDGSGDGSGE